MKLTLQQFDVILINMSDFEFDKFLEKLPEDMREPTRMRKAYLKLFSDVDYYNAVKEAVKERLVKEIYGK